MFDLPPIKIQVTEHQLVSRRCACGHISTGDAPTGAGAPVQYGPRILAVMVYLYMGQYLSRSRTAKAMSELFSTPVSEGTVSAATAAAGADLGAFTEQVAVRIAGAEVAHFDDPVRSTSSLCHGVLMYGELALTSTRIPEGATAEVARRQPDGAWLWMIDQPNVLA